MAQQTNRSKKNSPRQWQAHLKALSRCGLSRAEYCRQHRLSYHALSYWYKKYSRPNSSKTSLIQIPSAQCVGQTSKQAGKSPLKIILPGQLAIEVDSNFCPTTLAKLLTALEVR